MKKCLYLFFLLFLLILVCDGVDASSGRLRNDSIKTCNGITYGKHSKDNHWHIAKESNGKYYATGGAIYNDPCNSNNHTSNNNSKSNVNQSSNSKSNDNNKTKKIQKSSDNTLKTIIIDGKKFDATTNDSIEYDTLKEKVNIDAVVNDNKSKYEIKNNSKLLAGKNKIIIEVTAENGNVKTYNIDVIRKVILSSDTGIKVIINDEEIHFDDYKATVNVGSSVKKANVDYTLSDKKATVEIGKTGELKNGNNILNIKVTAEDGSKQKYEITIYRYSKVEEVIYTILGFSIIGGIGYGIYYFIKKIKNKYCNFIQ